MKQSRSLASLLGLLLSVGALIGLGWGNYHLAKMNIGGEGFKIQWISIRSLVTDGNSPYSDQVTARIRELVKYENSFAKGNPPEYTSPLYSGIIVLPFALIDNYTLAHALWLTAQLVAIFLILLVSLRIAAWKSAWYSFLIFSLFTTSSYHVIVPWLDGGLSIWAALFMMLAIIMIRNNWNEVSGIFLAMSAIQPQLSIVVIIFVLVWAAFSKKRLIILWFFITLVFLSIIGLLLVPDWIMQYIRIIFNYSDNFPPGSLAIFFREMWPGLGKQLGWFLIAILAIILILEWRLAMRRDFRWFTWTACLTIVISQWIGIPILPGNFIGLILPFILIAALLTERWSRGGQWVGILILALASVWEWALYYRDITSTQPGMQLNLIIPLPLILLIGLYWVRWWGIKPKRLLMEELKLSEGL